MKLDKKILLTSVVVLLLIFLVSCKEEKEPDYPLNGPIPQSDIVFMPEADPIHVAVDTKTLGFINADGSNRQEYTFKLIGGALSNSGYHIPSQYASHPRWSMAGDEIVFSIRDLPPNMRLIDEDGKIYGRTCKNIRVGELTFDLYGNALIEISENDQVYENYKEIADTALIARYDIKLCQIVSVFSVPLPFESFVREINESYNGLLTAAFWDWDEDIYKILIYDQITEEAQTLSGYHPSLTKDGAMLAYYNKSGTLVVRDMGTEKERKLISVFPNLVGSGPSIQLMSMPGWSPDNQWLVYNTPEGHIFKINVETKETVYLTYGWAPDWR